MSRSPYTRSGTRRLGDDYQDLIACELLVDWLEHSNRYQWIRVEADEAKFLDDVVVMRADGRVEVKQVKFSTNPIDADDPFTWEKLLAQSATKSGTKTQSLLQKWAVSLRELHAVYDIADASLVSNRIAGMDLVASLDRATGLVAFDRVSAAERACIIDQMGDESSAREFFDVFRFRLNELSLNDLEDGLRRRFDRLGGTEIGWLSLKNELRFWVAHRYEPPPDGSIKLSDVMLAARWHPLQSLPQRFHVPPDYVVPSTDFHREFQQTLLSQTKNCHVVTGSPGVGKSTYTSYLYEHLKDNGIPVIRHHYYLSQEDETAGVRLSHLRAAESLMHDLKHNYLESLGSHAGDNPLAVRLRDWLTASGNFYAEQNKKLIVILDGLDHVWRDTRSVEELSRLFNFILPTPDGVVVLLATQPVSDDQLPPILLRYASRDSWQTLPLMDQAAVGSWLHHHESEFLPNSADSAREDRAREYQFSRVAEALFEKSGGHPLHLRYTLRALQERDQLVTPENIANLPGCEHEDIRDYYCKLWTSLSEQSRGIIHLLAATQFAWTKRAILECLSPDASLYSTLSQSIKEVAHLLVDAGVGLNAYHASLISYVQGLEDHSDFRSAMQRSALNWLRNRAPEYLRWAHEWVIEADLGNDGPLSDGPTRDWLIKAISKRYPKEQVLTLLCRSIWAALESEDLPRAVEVGLLHDYCVRAFESDPEILEQLFIAHVISADNEEFLTRLRPDFLRLDESEISLLARHEEERGNIRFVGECLDELVRRLNAPEERTHVEWNSEALAVIEVASLLDDVNPGKLIDFVVSNRDFADAHEMLQTLAATLRAEKRTSRLRSVLMLEPSAGGDFDVAMREDEREYLVKHAVWLALEEGFELHNEARKSQNADDPYCLIYGAIKRTPNIEPRPSRLPSAQLFESKNHSPGDPSRRRKDLFYSCLAGFISNHLWDLRDGTTKFIETIGQYTKTGRCLMWLDLMAGRIADLLKIGRGVPFGLLYEGLKDFDDPAEGAAYDLEASGLRNDIARAVRHFAFDLLSASVAIESTAEISKTDLEIAFQSGYCHWDTWMKEYVARGRRWLNDEALSWLLDDQKSRLEISIEPFPERALTYSAVASVAARHERISEGRDLIERAVANMVAHGNHKDVLFFHVLYAIKECHSANIGEAKEWLLRIATPIAHIKQFTDGDETGHLPREFAEVLLEVDPARFSAYYSWLCDNEESYDALHAFNSFVEVADFSSLLNRAIAGTALDNGTLKILHRRAVQDTGASVVLESARSVLGEKGLQQSLREEARSSSDSLTRPSSPVSPASYPPANFEDYLTALESNEHVWKSDHIEEWVRYWISQNEDEGVLIAVDRAVGRGIELRNYDQVFELALKSRGREEAYPWLVKAHKQQRGWNRYYSRDEEAHRRWKYVLDLYPERWFDFIRKTLRSENETAPWQEIYLDSSRTARLIEYCIRLNKLTVARKTMKSLVEGSLQLVSMLPLTPPAWINHN